jgi:hypothetical protein
MHSTSECPSVVVASFLSQVLQPHADPRYFLSEKAASGVLRRASKRGRTLPPELEQALRAVALSTPSTPLGGGPDDNAAQAGHLISQPLSTPAATTEASAPSQVSTLSSPSTERERAVFGMTGFAAYTPGVTTLTATDHKRPEQNIVIDLPVVT